VKKKQQKAQKWKATVPLNVPADLHERILELSKRLGESQSTAMRLALWAGLSVLEKTSPGEMAALRLKGVADDDSSIGKAPDEDKPKQKAG
jgi:hypothetical protein